MTEEEKLAKAYLAFGLEGGASPEEVAERYKDLVMAWHSDRYPSGDKKLKAEEEMKKINNARDLLKKHFAENHKKTGPCACRPGTKTSQPPPQSGPKPDNKAEEEAARARNAQRAAAAEAARKAAEAAAAEQAQRAAQEAAEASKRATVKNAFDQQKQTEDEVLRWRVFLGIVGAWVLLSLFSIVSLGVEHVWHNVCTSVEHMFAKHDDPVIQNNSTSSDNGSNSKPALAPPDNSAMPPPQDAALEQIAEQNRRDEEARKQKTYDILKFKNDIDRAQKVIDHCNQDIAEMEVQIANPAVGDSERMKLIGYQNQQRNYLSQAQMDFNTAHKMLADLTGEPAPVPLPIEPHVVPQTTVIDQQELRRRADTFLNPNRSSQPSTLGQPAPPQIHNYLDELKQLKTGQ